jgi:hypothetical protein
MWKSCLSVCLLTLSPAPFVFGLATMPKRIHSFLNVFLDIFTECSRVIPIVSYWFIRGPQILCIIYIYLLTYGAEPFSRSCQLCRSSRTPQHFSLTYLTIYGVILSNEVINSMKQNFPWYSTNHSADQDIPQTFMKFQDSLTFRSPQQLGLDLSQMSPSHISVSFSFDSF